MIQQKGGILTPTLSCGTSKPLGSIRAATQQFVQRTALPDKKHFLVQPRANSAATGAADTLHQQLNTNQRTWQNIKASPTTSL